MDATMIVVASAEQAETMLHAGQLACPGCAGVLRPHGHVRARTVRGLGDARVRVRPRRSRCASCAATHVLLPAALCLRRADTVEVIGTALAAKARGEGHRTIAARLGRPVSTVRRWLRRARPPHAGWLYEQGLQHTFRIDPDVLVRPLAWPTRLGAALNLLAAAALAYQRRLDPALPAWTLIGLFARGRLLPPPLRT